MGLLSEARWVFCLSLSTCFRPLFLAIIQTFFLIRWFSLLLLQLLRHLFYRHLKLHRQRYILIVWRLMLVMVVFFIAFRWIHLSTPLIRLFLLVLILLLMPTLNFLPVGFALSLLRFRLPSRLPMMFILWLVGFMVWSNFTATKCRGLVSLNQVIKEIICLQPLK